MDNILSHPVRDYHFDLTLKTDMNYNMREKYCWLIGLLI